MDAAFHRGVSRENASFNDGTAPPSGTGNSFDGNGKSDTPGITLAGLLNAIDGVASQEGRILFATTNKYEVLDPALCRPGRFDVHLEFKLANHKQAEELFKCFYCPNDATSGPLNDAIEKERPPPSFTFDDTKRAASDINDNKPVPDTFAALSEKEVDKLANKFASQLPEDEFSMAALQGLLMRYKSQPHRVVEEVTAWVKSERAAKKKHEQAKRLAEEKAKKRAEGTSNPDGDAVEVEPEEETAPTTNDVLITTPPPSPKLRAERPDET